MRNERKFYSIQIINKKSIFMYLHSTYIYSATQLRTKNIKRKLKYSSIFTNSFSGFYESTVSNIFNSILTTLEVRFTT